MVGKFRLPEELAAIVSFATRVIVERCSAVAVAMRSGRPARHPSPKIGMHALTIRREALS